ncbi:MmyB family transcriptional regulator [Cohnella xylanilytica]|uniref:MmyB family transcriptional regulator n=1 Tax=Cohnella xylanilytica TaxID=557555 RepID=UPI002484C58F|nr:hypothetical protein [Cohnella xylanilytica]
MPDLPPDEGFKSLIAEPNETNEAFRLHWPPHDVQATAACRKRWNHPAAGELEFEPIVLQPSARPGWKRTVYSATPSAAERIRGLAAAGHQTS